MIDKDKTWSQKTGIAGIGEETSYQRPAAPGMAGGAWAAVVSGRGLITGGFSELNSTHSQGVWVKNWFSPRGGILGENSWESQFYTQIGGFCIGVVDLCCVLDSRRQQQHHMAATQKASEDRGGVGERPTVWTNNLY